MWAEHKADPYPHIDRALEIDGILLVTLDASVAGFVESFLLSRGKLDGARREALRTCVGDLFHVVPALPATAAPHFSRLLRLSQLVLAA